MTRQSKLDLRQECDGNHRLAPSHIHGMNLTCPVLSTPNLQKSRNAKWGASMTTLLISSFSKTILIWLRIVSGERLALVATSFCDMPPANIFATMYSRGLSPSTLSRGRALRYHRPCSGLQCTTMLRPITRFVPVSLFSSAAGKL